MKVKICLEITEIIGGSEMRILSVEPEPDKLPERFNE